MSDIESKVQRMTAAAIYVLPVLRAAVEEARHEADRIIFDKWWAARRKAGG